MNFEQTFAFKPISPEKLAELVAAVDEIESASFSGRDANEQLWDVNDQLETPMKVGTILSEYGATDKETFILRHWLPDPYDHDDLSEEALVWLVEKILANINDSALVTYYSRIVEISKSVEEGALMSVIAFQGDGDPQAILEAL